MSKSIVSKEKLMNAVTVAASDTHYSNSRRFHDCDGSACVMVVASGSGVFTVSQQCSMDNVTWYDPETSSGATGVVDTGITGTTGTYYSYSPVLCDYIRFKVVETGTSNPGDVSITIAYRVEV